MGFEEFAIFDDIGHKRDKYLAESHLETIEQLKSLDFIQDNRLQSVLLFIVKALQRAKLQTMNILMLCLEVLTLLPQYYGLEMK